MLDFKRSKVNAEKSLEAPIKMPSAYFAEDFMRFSNSVLQRDFSRRKDACWDTYIGITAGVEIPHTLLLGPWTEETMMHLYWMVKSGAQLDWITSTAGEVSLTA